MPSMPDRESLLWQHNPETSRVWVAEYAVHDAVSRGLAVWDGKVIAATLDGRLFALDARNGELLWSVLTHRSQQAILHYRRATNCKRPGDYR